MNREITGTVPAEAGPDRLEELAGGFEEFRAAFNAAFHRLGFTRDEARELNRDLDWAVYLLRYVVAVEAERASARAVCEALLTGPEGGLTPVSRAFLPPSMPASATPEQGIFYRLQVAIARLQASPEYTSELGEVLGLGDVIPVWPEILLLTGQRRGVTWTALAA